MKKLFFLVLVIIGLVLPLSAFAADVGTLFYWGNSVSFVETTMAANSKAEFLQKFDIGKTWYLTYSVDFYGEKAQLSYLFDDSGLYQVVWYPLSYDQAQAVKSDFTKNMGRPPTVRSDYVYWIKEHRTEIKIYKVNDELRLIMFRWEEP
jgi:hypothetical protein